MGKFSQTALLSGSEIQPFRLCTQNEYLYSKEFMCVGASQFSLFFQKISLTEGPGSSIQSLYNLYQNYRALTDLVQTNRIKNNLRSSLKPITEWWPSRYAPRAKQAENRIFARPKTTLPLWPDGIFGAKASSQRKERLL